MSEYLRSKRIIKAMEQPLHNRQKKRLQRQKENIKPSDFIIKNKGVNEGVNKGVKDNFEGVKDTNIIDGISVINDKLYKAIISLTSWRARINNVHITIENLISTCPGFKIVLVLSEEEFPNKENELPNNLMRFVRDNSIEILWVYKNYKSFKKVVFTMDKYRDVPIISADDDCIYLYNYAQEFYDIWKDNRDFFISGWGKKNNDVWELGGAATLYPPFIFKNFGIDCINDDLLKLTLQDDVYYQCLRKIMNLNKVIVTNNHNNMYKFHNEIEPIRNEYKKMNNDDMNILRSKIENLIIPKENIVIGVILEKEDLQRKNKIFDSNDYNLIKPFVETAFKFSYKVKILHNNLSDKFIEKYSNNLLEFIKVTPNKEYNVYINKFQLVYEYLSNNPVNKVLITDITDVIFLNNGLFDYFQDNIIYSGIETKMLSDSWIENNSLTIRNSNNKFNNWWNLNKNKLKLLNCGLIGGNYDLIKDNLKELIDILNLYTKNNNEISEMFTWNFVAYNSGKKIISGEPFHTEYKAYDLENKNCYIAHK